VCWRQGYLIGRDDREVFLDSDSLFTLASLKHMVCSSDVLVIIQSPGVFQRPWILLEIMWALGACKPIVAVRVDGLSVGAYDYAEADRYLGNLESTLDEANPGARELLEEHGVDLESASKMLQNVMRSVISTPFNNGWSNRMIEAMIDDLVDSCKKTAPVESIMEMHAAQRKIHKALLSRKMREMKKRQPSVVERGRARIDMLDTDH